MKTIYFSEYTYISHRYRGKVEISDEDLEKLENSEITMYEISLKYDLNYDGYSTPDYEDSKFDEYIYDGCNEDYSSLNN